MLDNRIRAKNLKLSNTVSIPLRPNPSLSLTFVLVLHSAFRIGLCIAIKMGPKCFRTITQTLALDVTLTRPEP